MGIFIALVMTMSLAACKGNSDERQEAVKSADGVLGTYEDNAYTRYLKERLNIEIKDEFEANGEDYDRQVSLAIASGELPDIMRVGSKDILDELVENDLVEDLSDVYEKYASDSIKEIYDSYDGRCNWLADEDGRVFNGSTSEGMKQALKKVSDWFQEGIVDPQFGTRTWDDITALLTNGQLGIAFGPWHFPDWLLNNVRSMDPEADFAVFTIADEDGKVNVTHSNASAGYMVVRKGYSNPDILVKMANLFFDERISLLISAMLFSGGMIPTYLVIKNLGLLNSVWALILPGAVPIF